MRIKEILKQSDRSVIAIEDDRTVHDAICRMNQHRVGALVVTERQEDEPPPTITHSHVRYSWGGTTPSVVESHEICGLITERDVMVECGERCHRLDQPAATAAGECPVLVRDVMTPDEKLIIGLPDDDLDYAARVMTKHGIKHLPILDQGDLVGIITLGDIIRARIEDSAFEARMLRDYVQGVY